MKHIFIVEDHAAIRESVGSYLELSGYTVSTFPLIADAQAALAQSEPDLLIQDVMMPDGDGFSFVKQLRTQYSFPIIFVTARASESDRIMGFELGGDDYVVKPFSPKEIVLRVGAIFRRIEGKEQESTAGETVWSHGRSILRFDEDSHFLDIDEKGIVLTAAEWRVLAHLISHAGNVVSRAQILDACFEYSFESYDRIVDTHIKNIRAKIGNSGGSWIETVRGYGYRFAGRKKESSLP